MKKRVLLSICGICAVLLFGVLSLNWLGKHKRRATDGRCEMNLQAIQGCKTKWMEDNHKTRNDIPSWDDLQPYLKWSGAAGENGRPICPDGGIYTLGRVGD